MCLLGLVSTPRPQRPIRSSACRKAAGCLTAVQGAYGESVSVLRGDAKVAGIVTFEQESELAPTAITWDISGNDPNAERGFHIHTFGDNNNGCTSAGPHFNPHGKTHGAPSDAARHDSHVKLIGPHSVIDRAVVVHAGTDDLGKGGNKESLKAGNAGPRPACGTT
ncbi:hypothetical protein MY4038_009318 [Beauveria bassiana]